MQIEDIETVYPTSKQKWRKWLKKNHNMKQSVWLIQYKKGTGMPSISWSEAVDEALCFGWIDSKKKAIDDRSTMQFLSKRKPNGTWSRINKIKVEQLIAEGRMEKAGLDCIEAAKKNGSWTILDSVEDLEIPKDLEKEFKKYPGSKKFFLGLSRSVKKLALYQLVAAKRPETRQKRVADLAELAGRQVKPA